jgi:hypothetical protein
MKVAVWECHTEHVNSPEFCNFTFGSYDFIKLLFVMQLNKLLRIFDIQRTVHRDIL